MRRTRVWSTRVLIIGAAVVWTSGVVVLRLLDQIDSATTAALVALGLLAGGLFQMQRLNRSLARGHQRQAAALTRLSSQADQHNAAFAALQAELDTLAGRSLSYLAGLTVQFHQHNAAFAALHTELDTLTQHSVSRDELRSDLLITYHQLEALQNLYSVIELDQPIPQTRGLSTSPDLLLLLVDLVRVRRPHLVVTCGSGTSTAWLALALRKFGIDGRVVALEHDQHRHDETRALIETRGLGDLAEVRLAPLEPVDVDGESFNWYTRSAWEDLTDIEILFVDGPSPASSGRHARLPALPLLAKHLRSDHVVVLNDNYRTDEREIAASWLRMFPDYSAEGLSPEKEAVVLRSQSTSRAPELTEDEAQRHVRKE
ncbi:class I SAM-dependent methyltransferase [Actinopolymorpha pittospori]